MKGNKVKMARAVIVHERNNHVIGEYRYPNVASAMNRGMFEWYRLSKV